MSLPEVDSTHEPDEHHEPDDHHKPDDHHEPHDPGLAGRLNWLRAGVLGANDGIVSTAAIVLGVAGATADRGPVILAGVVGLMAGALSMAVGEYVSVSTQRDTEKAVLDIERAELRDTPDEELEELTNIYAAKGIDLELARRGRRPAHPARRPARPCRGGTGAGPG